MFIHSSIHLFPSIAAAAAALGFCSTGKFSGVILEPTIKKRLLRETFEQAITTGEHFQARMFSR